MKIIPLLTLLAFCGCAHTEKLSDQPAQAASQIERWVPIGTPLTQAQRVMEQHHFTCSVMTNSTFGDLKGIDFLYCDYREANSQLVPVVYQVWQVALVLADGKISSVRVSTGLKGL